MDVILCVFLCSASLCRYYTRKLSWELPFLFSLCLSGLAKFARVGVLLTDSKTSVDYTVIINDLPLLTYCEWLCWTCLCWYYPLLTCVTARNTMNKWSRDRIQANVSYRTRTETFFRSDPPARMTCLYSTGLAMGWSPPVQGVLQNVEKVSKFWQKKYSERPWLIAVACSAYVLAVISKCQLCRGDA
jgi:hypothetical protein